MVNDSFASDEDGLFNWSTTVRSSLNGFCHSHQNFAFEDGGEMSRWDFVITSLAFVIAGTLGNTLLIGIIHYERFGGDPQKRSFRNRLTSEIVVCATGISNLCTVMFIGDLILSLDSSVKLNDFCVRIQRKERFTFKNCTFLSLKSYQLTQINTFGH